MDAYINALLRHQQVLRKFTKNSWMVCMVRVHAFIVIVKSYCLWVWLTSLELVESRFTAHAVKTLTCLIGIFLQGVGTSTLMEASSAVPSPKSSWSISRPQSFSHQKYIIISRRFSVSKFSVSVGLNSISLSKVVYVSLRMTRMPRVISRSKQILYSHSRTNLLCKWTNSTRRIRSSNSISKILKAAGKTRKSIEPQTDYCTYYTSHYSIKRQLSSC